MKRKRLTVLATPWNEKAQSINKFKFYEELKTLLNRHGIDSACETPDFLLATFIQDHLLALAYMNQNRIDLEEK